MYIHDINILYYVIVAILGCVVGAFINWCNIRLPENKKIFSKEMFDKNKRPKINYILMIVMAVLYIVLLYYFGIR